MSFFQQSTRTTSPRSDSNFSSHSADLSLGSRTTRGGGMETGGGEGGGGGGGGGGGRGRGGRGGGGGGGREGGGETGHYRNPMDTRMQGDMKKMMTNELEQRRLAWERDVVKMQEDFFKVKIPDVSVTGSPNSPAAQAHLSLSGNNGSRSPAGEDHASKDNMYRIRFELSDYEPDDISVRAEDDHLIVSAKRIEGQGAQSRVTKQFRKQVDIPENVQVEKFVSYLSVDGILTIEAPLDSSPFLGETKIRPTASSPLISNNGISNIFPGAEHVMRQYSTPSSANISSNGLKINSALPFTSNPFGSLETQLTASTPLTFLPPVASVNPNVFDTEYGPMLKMEVDLGRLDYRPDEVKVKMYWNKVSVSALHEEVTNGRACRREFHREFDIPEPIEFQTLRAMLDCRTGRLFIGASFASNTKHNMVSFLITKQMPLNSKQCVVEKHY